MKITAFLVVNVLAHAVHFVQAETRLRMVLNNGIVSPNITCNANDLALINQAFEKPLNRRNLRGVQRALNNDQSDVFNAGNHFEEDDHRDLQKSLSQCRNECGYLEPGVYCFKTGCQWYRVGDRKLQYSWGSGVLSNSTLCTTTTQSINNDLDFLVSQRLVSTSCQALLNATRKIKCFEDVMYGVVEEFRVLDSDTDKFVLEELDGQMAICNNKPLNFQVDVNACVERVDIVIYNGKTSRIRAQKSFNTTLPGPYSVYGINGTNKLDFLGEYFPVGLYKIQATPDGNSNKTRTRHFNIVANCTGTPYYYGL
jgi:hypothetical protein